MPSPPSSLPSQDLDAERSVLGAMLLDANAVVELIDELGPTDFYHPGHGKIFDAMRTLYGRSQPIDEVTVAAELKAMGCLDSLGGAAFLTSLAEAVPTTANARHYAAIVHERSLRRRVVFTCSTLSQAARDEMTPIADSIDAAQARIFELAGSRERRKVTPIKQVLIHAFKDIEKTYERHEAVTGTPTGFRDLDGLTAGLQGGDLVIVAGRPSMGKTAFALCVAQNASVAFKQTTVIFSLEMSQEQLVSRMLCAEARVDSQRVRKGLLRDSDWPRLARAAGVLAEAPIFIDDSDALTALEIRTKARRVAASHRIGLIVVDYLQLMRGRTNAESREREISEISRNLKGLAKELNVPVMALSQLNRMVDRREEKRPVLSDLRESGAIEQDADLIMFVHREEYYKPDTPDKGLAEIIVGKHRNGPTGTVKLKYFSQFTRFDDCDQRHEP
jgi:replicative DNA helicase